MRVISPWTVAHVPRITQVKKRRWGFLPFYIQTKFLRISSLSSLRNLRMRTSAASAVLLTCFSSAALKSSFTPLLTPLVTVRCLQCFKFIFGVNHSKVILKVKHYKQCWIKTGISGIIITPDGRSLAQIKSRICQAKSVFPKTKHSLGNMSISLNARKRVLKS